MIKIICAGGEVTIAGHAGYAAEGQDIVCAAVSSLAQTLVYSILEITEDKIDYSMESGYINVKFWTLSEQSRVLLESFLIGARMIAENYPEFVKVELFGKSE